jgi:hypothetical protein
VASTTDLDAPLRALEDRSGDPVLAFAGTVAVEALPPLWEYLARRRPLRRLNLILVTGGGGVSAARQLGLLLREYADHVSILVPHHARSAGTLLCLAADELVLGPLAELSPIDAHVGAAGQPDPGLPGLIAGEDVRAFPAMAREWFGVREQEDALQMLALVAQRIFPTSLTGLYRADRLVRRVAAELLAFQLPDAPHDERARIVNALVSGRDGHDDVLTRRDAQALGLKVRIPGQEEERMLWDVYAAILPERPTGPDGPYGLIAAPDFRAVEQRRRDDDGGLAVTWEVATR